MTRVRQARPTLPDEPLAAASPHYIQPNIRPSQLQDNVPLSVNTSAVISCCRAHPPPDPFRRASRRMSYANGTPGVIVIRDT